MEKRMTVDSTENVDRQATECVEVNRKQPMEEK